MNQEQTSPTYLKTRYTKKFPADLLDLQEKLLTVDESERITMAKALEHPWILRRGK